MPANGRVLSRASPLLRHLQLREIGSKEKRTDCPLLTLGLILDGSGFVRRSRVLDGNTVECRALVVMDRGIATQANLAWPQEHGYRYLVMSREAERIHPTGAVAVTTGWGGIMRSVLRPT